MPDPAMTDEERDVLAAELALGVLDGAERAAAQRLRLSDPDFAAAVERWASQLAPMNDAAADVAPDDGVWAGIDRRLGGPAEAPGDADDARVVMLERRVRGWRSGAFVSGAVAAALALVMILRPAPAPVEIVRAPDQLVLAQLTGSPDGALLAARYDPEPGALRIRAIALPEGERAGPQLAPELWVIPDDGVPRSLGLVAQTGTSIVAVAPENRAFIRDGATLAITIEPVAGAPHAAPGSAPVAAGKISTL
ncbi:MULTISPECIES: anti-sigma factor [unclassified Sphingomonas]|jgi:anti-sigma-K factor RskA|uniref:anti-sigma factor n=1 Tax=unclassified Sphingomonas TaxID=196159 RepID=UPI000832E0B2|nr:MULTISPECIES: anti-sigma factor [unclassified Sphingomonas]